MLQMVPMVQAIKDKNVKTKKVTFDELKKNNDITKAADKLEDITNNKLKKTDKNKILRNIKNQKQLANTIKNIDESYNNNDLKKYFER